MPVRSLDHLVLTVASIPATIAFYERIPGFRAKIFGEGRTALTFGAQKLNLHQTDRTFEPKAARPTPGSADLCFVVDDLAEIANALEAAGIPVEEGPVTRTGALGPVESLYVRDPDGNLIELSVYGNLA